jgi:hypothetical protein
MRSNDGELERAQKAEALASQKQELERLGFVQLGPNWWHRKAELPVENPGFVAGLALIARRRLSEIQS